PLAMRTMPMTTQKVMATVIKLSITADPLKWPQVGTRTHDGLDAGGTAPGCKAFPPGGGGSPRSGETEGGNSQSALLILPPPPRCARHLPRERGRKIGAPLPLSIFCIQLRAWSISL